MGAVHYVRGDLPEDTAISAEVLGGLHSALTDAAFAAATMGVSHAYRSAKVAVGVARAIKAEAAAAAAQRSLAGRAIRMDAIPAGSKLEYLAPGRVRFDGVEIQGGP